jgi:glucose/arabinose dehydrogenase
VTIAKAIAVPVSALALVACGEESPTGGGPPPTSDTLQLVQVATGFSAPVYLSAPPGDSNRVFVVEQAGQIVVIQNGQKLGTPLLDITSRVLYGGEQGLLSVAFHPQFATNHFFYVDYTRRNAAADTTYTMIERYTVSAADSNVADSATHKLILQITQPQPVADYPNHKGGLLLFGPDGKLYIGMGDGGSGGDPQNRAQNKDSLLGKLLRIDVDGGDPYVNPPNNPYTGGGGRGEIWAIGLRNPWRYAFDPPSGLLFIADVGQNVYEEVNVEPASSGGLNYGWNIMEGLHCYNSSTCSGAGLVLPAVEYDHSGGNCAVIGGFVYRGTQWPALAGQYFYADLCAAWLRSFTYAGGTVTARRNWFLNVDLGSVNSFGQDARGELYVLSGNGIVYRMTAP